MFLSINIIIVNANEVDFEQQFNSITEAFQSPFQYQSINVITGEYCENHVDLSVNGNPTLELKRYYSSQDCIAQGWHFNYPNILFSEDLIPDEWIPESHSYAFDEQNRLIKISTKSPDQNSIHIHYSEEDLLCIDVETNDRQQLAYQFTRYQTSRAVHPYVLSRFSDNHGYTVQYSYCEHPKERRLLLNKKEEPNGRYLITEYYNESVNNVDGKIVMNPAPGRDPLIGKVKLQKAPLGVDQTPIISNQFFYGPGYSEVYDAMGNKTVYYYGNLQKLIAIEHYWNINTLYRKERIFWDSFGQMTSRTIEDGFGNIQLCCTCDYDLYGNVTKSTIWGNLTGSHPSSISITSDGRPCSPGIEHFSKSYSYSEDGRYLLKEFNDYGLTIYYRYSNQKLAAKYIGGEDQIYKRFFYQYDAEGNLIKETEDDGSSFAENDWSNATERHYTRIYPECKGPAKGKPKTIEKGFVSLSDGNEILLLRTELSYSCKGELAGKAVYDIDSILIDESVFDYDAKGRIIHSTDSNGEEINREYDIHGNLVKEQKKEEEVLQTFDFMNRLIKKEIRIEGELKDIASYQYDYAGNQISSTDYYGNETRYQYDPMGRLIKTERPPILSAQGDLVCPVFENTFDIFDRIVCSKDPKGYETKTEYNARGKPVKIVHPDNSEESFEYNLDGSLRKKTSQTGISTLYFRDIFGRVVKEAYYDQQSQLIGEKAFSYTPFRLISTTDLNGDTTKHTYDEAGREIEISKGDRYRVEMTYNASGFVESKKEWYGNQNDECVIENLERDHQQKVAASSIHHVNGEVLRYREFSKRSAENPQCYVDEKYYNSLGQNVLKRTEADANGNLTTTIFNALNQPVFIEKRNSLGYLLTSKEIQYDSCGNKEKEIHAILQDQEKVGSYCIQWIWGPNNRLESITEGYGCRAACTTTYHYNSEGLLIEAVKPDRVALSFQYHPNGQVKRLSSSDRTIDYTYHYDEKGRLIETLDHAAGTSNKRAYNQSGHLIHETLANGLTLSSDCDFLGRLKKLTLPDQSEIKWEYRSINLERITRFSPQKKPVYSHQYLEYDLEGRLLVSEMIHQTGNIEYAYNQNQIASIHSPFWSQSAEFDDRNRLISTTIHDGYDQTSYCYAYNDLNQLTDEEGAACHSFIYDSLGNPLKIDGRNCKTDQLNQLTDTGTGTLKYDPNGQLIEYRDEENHLFMHYDALGRLLSVKKKNDSLISFTYDAFGRRQSKTVFFYDRLQDNLIKDYSEFYLWEGENEIGSVDEHGEIKELRILGIGLGAEIGAAVAIEIDKRIFAPIHDHRGNVVSLIDTEKGQTAQSYHYSAFGESKIAASEIQSVDNPWRFSSKRIDQETGLIYFGKRYYLPAIARWITKDPIGTPESINRYAYVLNQPLTRVDPYGLFSFGGILAQIGEFIGSVHHFLSSTLNSLTNHLGFENYMRPSIDNAAEILFGKTLLQLGGYYQDASEIGIYGKGELNDKVRITLINGILNARIDYKESLNYFSECHGGANIHYLFDATGGWCNDMIRAFFSRLGWISPVSYQLVDMWKDLINEMGGIHGGGLIIHYAHSIGSTHTKNALKLLSPEEKAMIRIYTFGSPSAIANTGLESVKNFISYRDGVPLLDPIGFFSGLLGLSENIAIVGSPWGVPLIDHMLSGGTYSDIIRILGIHFIKHYTESYH